MLERDGTPYTADMRGLLKRYADQLFAAFDGVKVIRIGDTEVEVEIDGKRRVVRF